MIDLYPVRTDCMRLAIDRRSVVMTVCQNYVSDHVSSEWAPSPILEKGMTLQLPHDLQYCFSDSHCVILVHGAVGRHRTSPFSRREPFSHPEQSAFS